MRGSMRAGRRTYTIISKLPQGPRPRTMSTPRIASPTAPNDAARAHLARGRELHRAGRAAEAIAAFDAAVAASPGHAAAQLAAGVANLQLARFARGVAHLRVAVAADPNLAEAWANLAHGWREMGQLAPAREAVERALALDGRLAGAWNLLGIVMQDLGQVEAAQPNFRRALEIDPRFALAQVNLANGEQTLGRLESAEREYRRALEIDPAMPELHYNYAHLFHKTGREREAIPHYRRAIALRPDYHLARNNLGHVLFLLGEFAEAWREYGGRATRIQHLHALARAGRSYRLPSATELRGARITALGEQGLGDILFFLRFVPELRHAGAMVEFAGEPRLHGMLARTGLFDHVGPAPRPGATLEVLAGDLALLRADPGAVAPPLRLVADPARLDAMRKRLAALGPAPYLAIAWRAGIAKIELTETLYKDVPLDAFGRACAGAPGTIVSVQREPGPGETEALARAAGRPVHDLSAVNEDLEEALAAMAAVDDYAGVSSTNVHLRASAGGGGRILVPVPPEWRWMAAGQSPWFPSFTPYRQERGSGWTAALERLAHDLGAPRGA
jgi:tetratricopeptide (TPR) repeat protein